MAEPRGGAHAADPPRDPNSQDSGLRTSFYLLRPYCSWLLTQSDDEMADASDSSPARTTPATISANLFTLPRPTHPSICRHSFWVGRPVPPPWVATISEGMVMDMYRSRSGVSSAYATAAELSDTFATSCPGAMKMAVIAFAECAPLLLAPLRMEPTLEICEWYTSASGSTRIRWISTSRLMMASAVTRLPRVRMMLICDAFLSVAKLLSR